MPTTLEQARMAKPKARAAVATSANVVGVGLSKIGDSYVIKVNLRDQLSISKVLPQSIDGVRLIYEVVGSVHMLHRHSPV